MCVCIYISRKQTFVRHSQGRDTFAALSHVPDLARVKTVVKTVVKTGGKTVVKTVVKTGVKTVVKTGVKTGVKRVVKTGVKRGQ